MLSSGWYDYSRMLIFDYDFEACKFDEVFNEDLEKKYFAEGITRINDKVYQLTWRESRILVWKLNE